MDKDISNPQAEDVKKILSDTDDLTQFKRKIIILQKRTTRKLLWYNIQNIWE